LLSDAGLRTTVKVNLRGRKVRAMSLPFRLGGIAIVTVVCIAGWKAWTYVHSPS